MCSVAVLGFAKAREGASMSANVIKIFIFIQATFLQSCRLSIGRVERCSGFKNSNAFTPGRTYAKYNERGTTRSIRFDCFEALVEAFDYADVSTCNSLTIKAYWSTVASMRLLNGIPAPCPALVSTRIRIGFDPVWAAWSAAVYLKLWAGNTRSSWSPVVIRVAG